MENIYLIMLLNIINFVFYGIDKKKARDNKWRISEKTLLTLSLVAGIGGLAGMKLFHHKTREKKFYLVNIIGILLNIYILLK